MEQETIRPTKKQLQLLEFIENFIATNGYSPSYREIMTGLNYTSVATVSLHVNSLISRGHLAKRGHSARSLELTKPSQDISVKSNIKVRQLKASEEKWLVDKVELFFKEAENSTELPDAEMDKLYVLIGALKVLGIEGAANAFIARLGELKKRQESGRYVA